MTAVIQGKDLKSLEGKKFRFVVGSAEEAVRAIREHLGDRARVIAVNQIGGTGLARFLSSPKLEVIATLPLQEPEKQKMPAEQELAAPKESPQRSKNTPNTPLGGAKHFEPTSSLHALLRRAGFDDSLLERIYGQEALVALQEKSPAHALHDLIDNLRSNYSKIPTKPLSDRCAFLGTPGCGKTTALCKFLTMQVFMHSKAAQVMKLENDTPNADDALRAFCDVLGAPLLRDYVDLDWIDPASQLCADAPGVGLEDKKGWQALKQRLDVLQINTRIWVINAAYDSDALKRSLAVAQFMQSTHLVLSHLDETAQAGKLWSPLLGSNLAPLFISHGQTLTGAFDEKVLEHLIIKTFPAILT